MTVVDEQASPTKLVVKRFTYKDESYRWPDAQVPYIIKDISDFGKYD